MYPRQTDAGSPTRAGSASRTRSFRRFKAQALMEEADKLSKEDSVIDELFGKPRWVA